MFRIVTALLRNMSVLVDKSAHPERLKNNAKIRILIQIQK